MSFAVSATTATMIKIMKSNIQYDLMKITRQMQQLNLRTSEIAEKYSKAMHAALTDSDDDLIYINLNETGGNFLDFNPETAMIHAQEKELQAKKQELEAQEKMYTAMEESNDKLLDSSIKESFGSGGGGGS